MLNSPFVTFNVLQYKRKTPAIRNRSKTRKEAKEKAKARGGDKNKEPIGPEAHEKDGNRPHYHPNVPDNDPRRHDHYYFPKRFYKGFFESIILLLILGREE